MHSWISESCPKVMVGLHCFRSGGEVPLSLLPQLLYSQLFPHLGKPLSTLRSACQSPNHLLAWGSFLPFMNEFL